MPPGGLEPPAFSLKGCYSAIELWGRYTQTFKKVCVAPDKDFLRNLCIGLYNYFLFKNSFLIIFLAIYPYKLFKYSSLLRAIERVPYFSL